MASAFRFRLLLPIALVIALGSLGIPCQPALAADIVVIPNQDLLVKLPPNVATIVVGNPLMADVSLVAGGGFVVITAKSYGKTNLILLDRTGAVLMERLIEARDAGVGSTFDGAKREIPGTVTAPNASILRFNGAGRIDHPFAK
jgi:Flp pilus assembly secretin CpaC